MSNSGVGGPAAPRRVRRATRASSSTARRRRAARRPGRKVGVPSLSAPAPTRASPVPSMPMRYTRGPPSRSETNATVRPSGDTAADWLPPGAVVSGAGRAAVGGDHVELRRAVPGRGEDDARAVGRPGRLAVGPPLGGETADAAAIGVHHEEVEIAVAVAAVGAERDAGTVGRERGLGVGHAVHQHRDQACRGPPAATARCRTRRSGWTRA